VAKWYTCLPAGRRASLRSFITYRYIKMYQVYAIKSCNRNYIYVGITNNFTRRLNEHQKGKEKTTRSYAPFKVIIIEERKSRPEARKREKYLKSGCGKEYLKSLLK
jgi:putative endonuclease